MEARQAEPHPKHSLKDRYLIHIKFQSHKHENIRKASRKKKPKIQKHETRQSSIQMNRFQNGIIVTLDVAMLLI